MFVFFSLFKQRPTELNRRTIVIVATTVGAGMLLIIVLITIALIVLLVKLKRLKKASPKLSAPVNISLGAVESSPEMLPTDQVTYLSMYKTSNKIT